MRGEEVDGTIIEEASVELGAIVAPEDPSFAVGRETCPFEEGRNGPEALAELSVGCILIPEDLFHGWVGEVLGGDQYGDELVTSIFSAVGERL